MSGSSLFLEARMTVAFVPNRVPPLQSNIRTPDSVTMEVAMAIAELESKDAPVPPLLLAR